jgi:hypothetical protein
VDDEAVHGKGDSMRKERLVLIHRERDGQMQSRERRSRSCEGMIAMLYECVSMQWKVKLVIKVLNWTSMGNYRR